ncbi:MAG: hypothetical protein WCP66_05385, partial [Methylococcales bacterium]
MKNIMFTQALMMTIASLSIMTAANADPIVVVVNAISPVTKLDKEQVANLFLGKSSSYPDG